MALNIEAYQNISTTLKQSGITLVAVSKTKPLEDILELYQLDHRDFGENYVQELVQKAEQLPKDIRWHFIGHLQTNKVKQVASFVHLIHGVDSTKLLQEIDKQAEKNNRVIDCLLQVHIAQEETKFGFGGDELESILKHQETHPYKHIKICGLMGMASFTDDTEKLRKEFKYLRSVFDQLQKSSSLISVLSMGMSSDYKIAIEEGGNMVRIGSLLFGERK